MADQMIISNLSSTDGTVKFNALPTSAAVNIKLPSSMVVDRFLLAENGFTFNEKIPVVKKTLPMTGVNADDLKNLMKRTPDSGDDEYVTVINSHHDNATWWYERR